MNVQASGSAVQAADLAGLVGTAREAEIFDAFTAFRGEAPRHFEVDFIGTKNDPTFYSHSEREARADDWVEAALPEVGESFFQWLDILAAVLAARERFTMLEFGAGFGCWGVRGIFAARQRRITQVRVGFVEADPIHSAFLRQHLANNAIEAHEVDVFEGAISEDPGETLFYVKQNVQDPADTPQAWYGQSIVPAGIETPVGIAKGAYGGKDLLVFPSGRAAIAVQRFSASRLVRRYDAIDLVDLDVQGEEFSVIYGAMEALNDRAKRLHIGTHSHEIEGNLRALLRANEWRCLRDYPCQQTNETPFGAVAFGDGVQTWINPRLSP